VGEAKFNRGCFIPILLIVGTLLMSWVVFEFARKLDEPLIMPATMPSPMDRRAAPPPLPTTVPTTQPATMPGMR
jgi:hypothetical protein